MTMSVKYIYIIASLLALLAIPPASAQILVTACFTQITSQGSYVLTSDLTCNGVAVKIDANNVDFNLDGHTLSNTAEGSAMAIQIGSDYSNCTFAASATISDVTIRNGSLNGGISVCTATRIRITGLHVLQTPSTAILLMHATESQVDANVIEHAFMGIDLYASSDNKVFLNQISGGGNEGIHVGTMGGSLSHRNQVLANKVFNAEIAGVWLAGDNNTFADNTLGGNTAKRNFQGILVENGVGNVFLRNVSWLNETYDFYDYSAGNCTTNTWVENTFKVAYPTCIH